MKNHYLPFLKNRSTEEFEVYGVENFEVLYFGKIKDISSG